MIQAAARRHLADARRQAGAALGYCCDAASEAERGLGYESPSDADVVESAERARGFAVLLLASLDAALALIPPAAPHTEVQVNVPVSRDRRD